MFLGSKEMFASAELHSLLHSKKKIEREKSAPNRNCSSIVLHFQQYKYNYWIFRIMPFFVLILIEGFSFSDNLITDGFLELFMYQTYSIAKSGSWIMLFFLNRVFSQLPCYLYIFQGKPETGALKVFQRRKYSLKYYQTSNLFCLPPKIVGYLFFLLENG